MPIIRGTLGAIRQCITERSVIWVNNGGNPNHNNDAGVNRSFNKNAVSMLRWWGVSRDPQLQQPNALTTKVKI